MRRALLLGFLAGLLASLALAGTAAAAGPPDVTDSVVGKKPIRVTASITPPVQTFGNSITATVSVLADRKWIDPADLEVVTHFFPYEPARPPVEQKSQHGRYLQIEWTWTLRCLTATCVPTTPPSDLFHVFHFRAASVHVLGPDGKVAYSAAASFPDIEALSEITPGIAAYLHKYGRLQWQYVVATPPPSYRVSPTLVFWLALVVAGLFIATGVAVVVRFVVRLRSPRSTVAEAQSSSLERALAVVFWAGGHGDETLQRKALERVAAELPFDVADLSDATRELAWSPETPEEGEVEAISEKAGVLAHPQEEADE
jgi:hypothetical protein